MCPKVRKATCICNTKIWYCKNHGIEHSTKCFGNHRLILLANYQLNEEIRSTCEKLNEMSNGIIIYSKYSIQSINSFTLCTISQLRDNIIQAKKLYKKKI